MTLETHFCNLEERGNFMFLLIKRLWCEISLLQMKLFCTGMLLYQAWDGEWLKRQRKGALPAEASLVSLCLLRGSNPFTEICLPKGRYRSLALKKLLQTLCPLLFGTSYSLRNWTGGQTASSGWR